MQLQTTVHIDKATFAIEPAHRLLFVGSCFADNMGRRFTDGQFDAVVNPYGVMYNPASVGHTVSRAIDDGTIGSGMDIAVFTLGTNHVYILKETGEIVDNCRKRPQRLFTEKCLSVGQCRDYLREAVEALRRLNPDTKVIVTVSPIRYQKYGFHESQLSKATLLLAAAELSETVEGVAYFPAYEIMNDELRDYRFYQPDMLHPSDQAVDYIYERFAETYFSEVTKTFQREWQPISRALSHRPFNPDNEEYKEFQAKAQADKERFIRKWKSRE